MKKKNKTSRMMRDQKLISGLQKHLGTSSGITLLGENRTIAQVVALLQARIDAAGPVAPAHAAWIALVKKERDVVASSDTLVSDLVKYVEVLFSTQPDVLADFGLAPKSRPHALSIEEKSSRLAKARGTRSARKTMGSRQKEKVKGVAETPATPPPPPTTTHT
jgi:hypothetical protein